MSVLKALTDAIRDGSVEVIDLTAPLSSSTPIIQLPPPFGNTARFGLTEISHYDERGPAWYWNDIVTGEHTGTHFDAPVHWVTGKDREDAARVPVARMIVALAARDPGLLGVVGLDRSIEQVKQAIGLFNASGIPVVATTLSADGIGGTYPHNERYYFQLSASNTTEAGLILHYIQEIVPRYFRQ